MHPINLLLVFVLFLGAFAPATEANEKLRLQLKWRHQFQFAGYYIAQEKGWYREAGLDVEIKEAMPWDNVLILLGTRNADYAIGSVIGLIDHQQYPFVALAAIFQHTPGVLLVRADSGIRHATELRGKRIMLASEGNAEILAMLHAVGLKAGDYQRQEISQDIHDLIEGRTDAMSAYLGDQPEVMKKMGVPGRVLRPQDYGVNFYGDVLYTLPQEIDDHPQRARAFLEASLRGWRYAFEHVDETIDIILKHYNTQNLTRDQLLAQASAYREMAQPDQVELGSMTPARWQHIAQSLAATGLLRSDWTLNGFLREPRKTPLWRQWLQQHWPILLVALLSLAVLAYLNRRRRALSRKH